MLELEGVNLISFSLDPGGTKNVDLGTTPAQLQMLLVNPSVPADTLTVKIDGKGSALKLDQPMLLGGGSAASLIGNFKFLEITNGGADPVKLDIVVGRKPTS
jgi:hypothetical protein